MKIQSVVEQLKDSTNEAVQIDAVNRLRDHLDVDYIFKVLCITSVTMISAKVREAILAALCTNADQANDWFVRAARNTNNPTSRRLALLNLSLLESRSAEARAVVLQGLKDPDPNIQHAAALCAGLFDDVAFLKEVGRFLERNRFAIACTGFQRAMFKPPSRRPSSKAVPSNSSDVHGVAGARSAAA